MYLLFDIGATNTRVATAKTTNKLQDFVMFRTPKKFQTGIQAIITAGKSLTRGAKINAIAGGAPGTIDAKHGTLVHAPNLGTWDRKPIVTTLTRAFRVPTYLQNDTAMVGLGEAVFGAGKGKEIVAYVTVSTGVNGVRIVDGRIDKNAHGFEIGFQIVSSLKLTKTLRTSQGYWGNFISGNSVSARYGKSPKYITNAKVWNTIEKYVAIGINNTILYWSPHIIVIGGSMMKSPGINIAHVRTELSHMLKILPKIPPISLAKLGDVGGLFGSLAFFKKSKM